MAQGLELRTGDLHPSRDAGEQEVKDGGFAVHDTAGESQNGHAVIEIAQQQHGPRQHWSPVGDNLHPRVSDGARGAVIGVMPPVQSTRSTPFAWQSKAAAVMASRSSPGRYRSVTVMP